MTLRWRLILLAVLLLTLAVTARFWLTPLLTFVKVNSDIIQALDSLLAILLGLGGLVSGFLALRRTTLTPSKPTPSQNMDIGYGDFIEGDPHKAMISGGISGGIVTLGNGNTVTEQTTINVMDGKPATDPEALRIAYLNYVYESTSDLTLSGIDRKAINESETRLKLNSVYTGLRTTKPEETGSPEDTSLPGSKSSQGIQLKRNVTTLRSKNLSAVEQLNLHKRLVLLGDPGSGKSTFVNFVALCMAGEALNKKDANLELLTAPLPKEPRESEEPKAQPWNHGVLIPVKVILRDFAARGLPPAGQRAFAKHLWDFIISELNASNLGEYSSLLNKHLREEGGLLLVDGLDEVPEADLRRMQIRQVLEDFARSYPNVHILVTSRTYAYQNQDWRLADFQVAELMVFSQGQIDQFIDRWYKHIGIVRGFNVQDAEGRAKQLKQAIFASDRLMGLAERPLLLTLMASLHAWRGGALPEKREPLYNEAVDLLLDWWERPKEVRDTHGGAIVRQPSLAEWLKVDREKVRNLLNELAYHAHSSQPGLTGTADVPQAELVAGLMRLTNNPDVNPVRLIEYLRDRAGLILARGEGIISFPHRTFQEYLSACYLTDHDYPEKIAELACDDINRWREVALLAGAKAGRGTASAVWTLVDALCYSDDLQGTCREENRLWGAHLAAQVLVENVDLEKVSERNRPKVERVRNWLANILKHGDLPPRERVSAGDNLARLGDPRFRADAWFLPAEPFLGFVEIPAGEFLMGSDPEKDKESDDNEKPQHRIDLPTYYIARYPVTVAQFRAFVDDQGYKPQDPDCLNDLPTRPVRWVTWYDAMEYCHWLTGKLAEWELTPQPLVMLIRQGWQVSLPSETEWEKAARGEDGRIFPWGNPFDENKANTYEVGIGDTSAVGCFPGGASPYGVVDLSGNVWEWTHSSNGNYPYPTAQEEIQERESLKAIGEHGAELRGGSFLNISRLARCAYRRWFSPDHLSLDFGFRVVLSPFRP